MHPTFDHPARHPVLSSLALRHHEEQNAPVALTHTMTNVETRFLSVDGQTGSQLLQSGDYTHSPIASEMRYVQRSGRRRRNHGEKHCQPRGHRQMGILTSGEGIPAKLVAAIL